MVAGRTFAMAANRVIDRGIDAHNPRTAQRELVTGAVSARTAVVGALVALAVFLAAAALLNPLCLALAPLAVVPLIVYPYGKRFTWAPHAILALAQAVAPIGAWLAVTGHWSWRAVVLGVAVGLWIGGFDLIYACQDVEVDRSIGVRSFPARFGVRAALIASSVTHVLTFGLFVTFGALVGSRAARLTLLDETGISFRDAHWRADLASWLGRDLALDDRPRADLRYWTPGDLAGGPASGSYPARGMVVVPARSPGVQQRRSARGRSSRARSRPSQLARSARQCASRNEIPVSSSSVSRAARETTRSTGQPASSSPAKTALAYGVPLAPETPTSHGRRPDPTLGDRVTGAGREQAGPPARSRTMRSRRGRWR